MSKMNDDLFEDVPYSEENAPVEKQMDASKFDDSLFDDSIHPEFQPRTLASEVESQTQEELLNRPDVSKARAALVGAGQGATFGFADEITAPIAAGVGMMSDLPSESPEETTWEKYKRLMQLYRDTAREEQKGAQEQHPGYYTAGAVAGGLMAPGLGAAKAMKSVKDAGLITKTAVGAGVGAGMGGLAGLGEAEGSLEERVPEAIETAKMGATVGAAIPVVGAGLSTSSKALGKITELPLLSKMKEAFSRGAKGENLVTESGRRKAADIIREKSGELYDDIKALQDEVGEEIGSKIDEAQEAGEKVDLNEAIPDVLNRLQKIQAEGSQEAAAYASAVEKEIKKILKIKPDTSAQDLAEIQAREMSNYNKAKSEINKLKEVSPEGMVFNEPEAPTILSAGTKKPNYEVTPKQAQDLKQVLSDYSPRKGMVPQEREPAMIAKELKGTTGSKLDEITGLNEPEIRPTGGRAMGKVEDGTAVELPSLNEQYGAVKDTLKRLKINEKLLPEQIKEKVNRVISRLGDEATSGDDARAVIEDVVNNIKKVSPELAEKYSTELTDLAGRLKLSKEITKGMQSGLGLGTLQGGTKAIANMAGLAANKTKVAPLVSGTSNFAKAVLNSPAADKATIKYKTQGAEALEKVSTATEPYMLQRKVAQAAETADPELLKEQAQDVRNKHGKQGEQLAMILENMANENKDARRALMFTVMQNAAYRKMLGLSDEQKK